MVTVSHNLIPYRCLDRTVVTVLVVNPSLQGKINAFADDIALLHSSTVILIILESIEADLITLRN